MSVRFPSCSIKQGSISASTACLSMNFAADMGFSHAREVLATNKANVALGGKGLNEVARICPLDCSWRRQNRHQAGTGALGGRLDRRHRADERRLRIGRPQFFQNQRRRRVAGDHRDLGIMRRDQLSEQIDNPAFQGFFLPLAIGETGVVRDIDETPVRYKHAGLSQHGQAAYA